MDGCCSLIEANVILNFKSVVGNKSRLGAIASRHKNGLSPHYVSY